MRKSEKASFSPPLVGATSLLVIFAVLCLTVFALLTLSTAQADNKISLSSAQSVKDYYAADCSAQEILARIRSGEIPDGVIREGNTYTFECPLSQTQTLYAEVIVENGNYSILKWETAATSEWEDNATINVWQGEE